MASSTTMRNEDYLEAIFTVTNKKGYAKVRDVAAILGVSLPSVTEMFQKLSQQGLVNYEKYSGVTLTKEGEAIASRTRQKHNTIRELLIQLGVDPEIAEQDACKIEHNVSPDTMAHLARLVDFINDPETSIKWLELYKGSFKKEV